MKDLNRCQYPPTHDAVLIGAAEQSREAPKINHPLFSVPRVALTLDLINACGALTSDECEAGRPATVEELQGFHTRGYVEALRHTESLGYVRDEYRERHNLGNMENPYFPGCFRAPAVATGSSIQAAEQVLLGRTAFSPSGGMHHALPDQARGFSYFNDPVLAILRLKQAGLRVLYVDVDAHHANGVEYAFQDDPTVFTFSLHMDTAYAYPFTGGTVDDQGGAPGRHACLNVPLPRGTHDAEYELIFNTLWPWVLMHSAADAVVLQAGTDILHGDPLGKLRISTAMFLSIVARIVRDSPRLLVLGGGGYHPLLLARAWTGVWAILSGRALPETIPPAGQALLRAVSWELDDETDEQPHLFTHRSEAAGRSAVRPEIARLLTDIRERHPLTQDI